MTDNKSQRWAFTAFEQHYDIVDAVSKDKELVKMLKFQDEVCPDTGRKHRQGCILTQRPVRFSKLRAALPGVHIEQAKNWTALLAYCEKNETRDPSGSQVTIDNTSFSAKKVSNFLDDIADYLWTEWDNERDFDQEDRINTNPPDHPTRSNPELIKAEYWRAVSHIVRTNPEAIGVLAQPLPQNAWKHTRQVWLERSSDRRWSNSITLQPSTEISFPSINAQDS